MCLKRSYSTTVLYLNVVALQGTAPVAPCSSSPLPLPPLSVIWPGRLCSVCVSTCQQRQKPSLRQDNRNNRNAEDREEAPILDTERRFRHAEGDTKAWLISGRDGETLSLCVWICWVRACMVLFMSVCVCARVFNFLIPLWGLSTLPLLCILTLYNHHLCLNIVCFPQFSIFICNVMYRHASCQSIERKIEDNKRTTMGFDKNSKTMDHLTPCIACEVTDPHIK